MPGRSFRFLWEARNQTCRCRRLRLSKSSGVPTPIRYRGWCTGHGWCDFANHLPHDRLLFTNTQTPDGITVKPDLGCTFETLPSQIEMRSTLNNSEKRLRATDRCVGFRASAIESLSCKLSNFARERAAQRAVNSMLCRDTSGGASPAAHSSNAITMSEPSAA